MILTTNFDTLIEESCSILSRDLQVFAVSAQGSLPSFRTVYAQDSLVKLHGDILETRADETLNHSPKTKDLTRFFEYLRGSYFSSTRPQPDKYTGFTKSHLLVLGYSGDDERCMQLIKFVLSHDPEFRVYWVCNSGRTLRKLTTYFQNESDLCSRIIVTENNRTDLLLYSLYQQLNSSLPGGGINYEFTHSVPPISSIEGRPPEDPNARKKVEDFLSHQIQVEKSKKKRSRRRTYKFSKKE